MSKLGVIDVGGGLRGVYASGVFDRCLDEDIRFDTCIGVSAGSANLVSYLAGQRGRNYPFYTDYPFRREYMGLRPLLSRGSYLDLDYIYGTLSNTGGENPLDYPALRRSPGELVVVACCAVTGDAKYFTKEDLRQDDYSVLKASSAIPFVCRPYKVAGVEYYDGALGDPVPLDLAFSMGCERAVLVLSKPKDTPRTPGRDPLFADLIQKKYPLAAEKLRLRAERYNRAVAEARLHEAQGRVLIVSPDDTCGVDTLTRKKDALRRLYEKGYRDGGRIRAFAGRS
ncbi:MAG: patatin family protein [Oscillibacter sp.]|nr:patatin family protein [Oscillibacter sp.]